MIFNAFLLARYSRCAEAGCYDIGFDKHDIEGFMRVVHANDPRRLRASRSDVKKCYSGDVCIEAQDVTQSRLRRSFPDNDVRVYVSCSELYDSAFVVTTEVRTVIDMVLSCVQYDSVQTCFELQLDGFSETCCLIICAVRDSSMRDKTWYNVQVRGDDKASTVSAMRVAAQYMQESKRR
jgi:hypothetical protein